MDAREEERLSVLAEYGLLDSPPEPEFDRLVSLAARVFGTPIALISLIERDRQYFKAKVGIDLCETSRDLSFCAHTITRSDLLIVDDATRDPRFSTNPFVTGAPHIRFYAGVPLVGSGGHALGSLCVVDFKTRNDFGTEHRKTLADIADLVMQQMEVSRLRQAEIRAGEVRRYLAATERNFRLLVESVTDYAIYMLDPEGVVTNWNPGAQRLKGYASNEIVGRSFAQFYCEDDRAAGLPQVALQRAAAEGRLLTEGWRLRKDGSRFWASVVVDPIRDESGTLIGYAKITRDITDRKRNEERLFRLAHFDSLTGLPNRLSLTNTLEDIVRAQAPAVVLMLDLDGFKDVNDTLGHSIGDAVLKAAAARMVACVGDRGSVGRFGGDEFVVLLRDGSDRIEAEAMSQRLLDAFRVPFGLDSEEMHLGLSIGISLFPQFGDSAEELLSSAELALYRAKGNGRHGYSLFQPALRQAALARRAWERELHDAFANNEFELFYQPQVCLGDGRTTGAEALLRWRHPRRGLLAPGAFIDVLERSALAQPVGEWILDTACAFAAAMRQKGHDEFRIAVNLFEAQFRKGNLVASVMHALEQHGLPAHALEVEITENIILQNSVEMLAPLRELRALGVGLAFDDYGTGYASLSLLKRFPLTRLKIDRSFVQDLTTNAEDAAVVTAILYLAEQFGLDVLAEGVEADYQETALRNLRCRHAQGYLFGRPVPAEHFLNGCFHASSPRGGDCAVARGVALAG